MCERPAPIRVKGSQFGRNRHIDEFRLEFWEQRSDLARQGFELLGHFGQMQFFLEGFKST